MFLIFIFKIEVGEDVFKGYGKDMEGLLGVGFVCLWVWYCRGDFDYFV